MSGRAAAPIADLAALAVAVGAALGLRLGAAMMCKPHSYLLDRWGNSCE